MKRIWRIPLFLLIVFILGVSIMAVAVIYNSRVIPSPLIVLGAGTLIDGYHVEYGENLEAEWTAQMLRLSSNGSFALDLRFDYISENPTESKIYYSQGSVSSEVDFEFVTSVALMQVESVYKVGSSWRDVTYDTIAGIIPNIPKFSDSKSCLIEYRGKFSPEVNLTKTMTKAYALVVRLSWIRVFREKNNGTFYYQWLQGNQPSTKAGRELVVDETYYDISGSFLVYYPIPENVTSPLLPMEFNYVKWIRENI